MKRLRAVRSLLVIVRARTANSPLVGRHERFLLRWLVVMALVVCRHAERNRHRQRQPRLETGVAYCCLGVATMLAWSCRWVVGDRHRFAELLLATRRDVFHEAFTLKKVFVLNVPLVVLSILWSNRSVTVVHTACPNFTYLYALSGEHVRFLVSSYWMKFEIYFLWQRVVDVLVDPLDRRAEQVTWLGNTESEVTSGRRQHQRSVLVNNNCFINEVKFPLLPARSPRRFDAVLNANAATWKRHYLVRDIRALAYMTYSTDKTGRMIWPVDSYEPAYRNAEYLDERERGEIYADACCGLALSACEGANYATGEFLLSGLPVVSTPSIGGREVWLTDLNATVCAPTCECVAQAVEEYRRRTMMGEVDRGRIRSECLALMEQHRERFCCALQDVFDRSDVAADARALFSEYRKQDRLLHSLSFSRIGARGLHPYCGGGGWHSLSGLPTPLLGDQRL